MHKRSLVLTAAALMFGACGTERGAVFSDDTDSAREGMESNELSWSERGYLRRAYAFALFQHEAAHLAETRSASPLVRDLAKLTHTTANAQLEKVNAIASDYGLYIEPHLNFGDKHQLGRLKNRSGADFDEKYLEYQLADMEAALDRTESIMEDTWVKQIRCFAHHALPELRRIHTLSGWVSRLRGTPYDADGAFDKLDSASAPAKKPGEPKAPEPPADTAPAKPSEPTAPEAGAGDTPPATPTPAPAPEAAPGM